MRILCLSDTHDRHPDPEGLPACDLLIHAGDATMRGRPDEARRFARWLCEAVEATGAARAAWIPGNHDCYASGHDLRDIERWRLPDALVVDVLGLRVGATSASCWIPEPAWAPSGRPVWYGWATAWERAEIFGAIPSGLDILITHAPPAGCLSRTVAGVDVGDPELAAALARLERRPRLHVFGHIHEDAGRLTHPCGAISLNAAYLDEHYCPAVPTVESWRLVDLA